MYRLYFYSVVVFVLHSVCCVSSMSALASSTEAHTKIEAVDFVENLLKKAISIINAPNTSDEEVIKKFQGIVKDYFDSDSMVTFILGKSYSKALDREVFTRCFVNMVVRFYASNFKAYKVAKFSTAFKDKTPSMFLVESTIYVPGKEDAIIVWYVSSVNGKLKISDVHLNGLTSMKKTQRDEIRGAISENGVSKFMSEFQNRYGK